MKASLAEIAPQFSDHFVHFPNDTRNYVPTNFGPEITLTKSNIETGYSQELGRGHVAVCSTTALQVGFQMPAPSARPPCLLSVQNELEWEIQGIVVSADTPEHLLTPDYPGAQHFLGYSRVRLPVGWERIDVYPALADEYWKPEYASAWAELDILAEIVRRNSLETDAAWH